jgi:hypothetical protein
VKLGIGRGIGSGTSAIRTMNDVVNNSGGGGGGDGKPLLVVLNVSKSKIAKLTPLADPRPLQSLPSGTASHLQIVVPGMFPCPIPTMAN